MNKLPSEERLEFLARKSLEAQALLCLVLVALTALLVFIVVPLQVPETVKTGVCLAAIVVVFWQLTPFYRSLPSSFQIMSDVEPRGIRWWFEIARISLMAFSTLALIALAIWVLKA